MEKGQESEAMKKIEINGLKYAVEKLTPGAKVKVSKTTGKSFCIQELFIERCPLFVFENGLEVVVAEGSEKLISKIVVNGRVFVPKP